MTAKEIHFLFTNWGFSRQRFAQLIGMKKNTFYGKLNPNNQCGFTPQELAKINLALSELKKQLPDG